MKPYPQLSTRGKISRLRGLARLVLQEYPLPVSKVRFLAQHTNTLFRVDTAAGKRYALRIYSDEDSTLQDNRTEVFWLSALRRETDLSLAAPLARRDGSFISIVSAPGCPPEERCVLFEWAPGRSLDGRVTPQAYFQLGQLMAGLHNHAESLPLPPEIHPKRWDKVFYYPHDPVIYRLPEYQHLFTPQRIALMDTAIPRCNDLLASLYAGSQPPMLIHGDLHPGNVHLYRGRLYLLDFEDISLGFPVQDVAVTLYYERSRPDYPELVSAFQAGYTSRREWPVTSPALLAGLMAARNLNFINYAARIHPEPGELLAGMFARLENSLVEMSG